MKKVIQIGDPILEKKSQPIDKIDDRKTQQLIDDLLDVCRSNEESTAGLSAPQIGINQQVFIARRVDLEEEVEDEEATPDNLKDRLWEVFINPHIQHRGNETSTFWEGCLSIKDVFGPVSRSSSVDISYTDRFGESKTISGTDYFAHVLQHEFDHLHGILFIKYVADPENLWKNDDLERYIDAHGKMPQIV